MAVVDHQGRREMALKRSMHDPISITMLRHLIKQDTDIAELAKKPRTDEDIVTALVWRYLMKNIFNSELLGSEEATSRLKVIRELEKLMIASAMSPQGK